jgi:DNA polymerase (family 10)
MAKTDTQAVARLLREYAQRTSLRGGNPYRAKAYLKAADSLQNLSIARGGEMQLHLHKAAALVEHAVSTVSQQHPEYVRVEIAGDFRKGCELITDLALVAETRNPSKNEDASGGLSLAVSDKKHFGAALLHATGGSAEHLERLAALAHDKGFELKPDALYRGRRLAASATEKGIYEALDLQFIEPELREDRDEIARAARHELPKLVSDKDLLGILHCHTTASTGRSTS